MSQNFTSILGRLFASSIYLKWIQFSSCLSRRLGPQHKATSIRELIRNSTSSIHYLFLSEEGGTAVEDGIFQNLMEKLQASIPQGNVDILHHRPFAKKQKKNTSKIQNKSHVCMVLSTVHIYAVPVGRLHVSLVQADI